MSNVSPLECNVCAREIDGFEETHYRLNLEKRPVPDADEMEVDDWLSVGCYLCQNCVKEQLGIDLE